jgi:hypothetical protein
VANYSIGVTPQQDADYLAAVERGDMETAQRMVDEAARAAGYVEAGSHGLALGELANNQFDPALLGTNTRAASAELGYFFASEKTARNYGLKTLNAENAVDVSDLARSIIAPLFDLIPQGISRELDFRREYGFEPQSSDMYDPDDFVSSKYDGVEVVLDDAEFRADDLPNEEQILAAVESARARLEATLGNVEFDSVIDVAMLNVRLKMQNPALHDQQGKRYRESSFFDIIKAAKDAGNDGVIIRNTYDGGPMDDVKVVFDPTHIKSADPVTRDSQGNVIPLSQRFDATTGNINYSIGSAAQLAVQNAEMAKEIQRKADAVVAADQEAEDVFFTQFWPKMLKKAGLNLKPTKANLTKAAEYTMPELLEWLKDNPQYLDYYHKDWDLTKTLLQAVYPNMTDDQFIAFRLFTGITSPNTKLRSNMADAVQLFDLWMREGSIKSMEWEWSAKGNRKVKTGPFMFSGTTGAGKTYAAHVLEDIFQELGSWQAVLDHLYEAVTVKEINAYRNQRGWATGIEVGKVKEVVKAATGQSDLIPRMFIFGPKVGAYTLNTSGDDRFTTTDIWEGRFIRSHFPSMFETADGLPVSVEENRIFQEFSQAFNEVFQKMTGLNLPPSALQAVRWFFMLNHAKKAGYRYASTDDTISGYAAQAIRGKLGFDLGVAGQGGRGSGQAGDGAGSQAGAVSNYSIASGGEMLSRYEGMPSVVVEGGRPYSPIVRDLLQRRAAGENIPREVIDQAINENFPAQLVEVPRSVAELPDRAIIDDAIDKGQRDKRVDVSTIEAGDKVAIRQDVPAMTRKGVGVVTVKSKAGNSYEAAVRITEPEFILNEKKSLRIAMGEAKGPHIVINGKWAADQSMPDDLETWTQVGYNPDRHSFYYDRATMQQVTGGSEAYQIGNTVFVKDAQYGDGQISDISYSISTQSEIDRVGAALNRLDRDPLERVKIYAKAQEKFLRVMADNREMLAGMQDGDLAQMRRTQILQALGELDGIISVLPPEVRSKIGGYTQLAKVDPMDVFKGDQKVSEVRGMSGAIISAWMREGLNIGEAQKKTELPAGYRAERNLDPTRADRAIADVFIQRINRINEALEKFLRDEYNDAAVELFKRAKPQRSGAGEKPKGKLGPDVHDLFEKLKEATEWSAEKAQSEADKEWARIENGELNPYEETHAMMAAQMVPLFADWANADSSQRAAAVTMGKDVLNRAYKAEQQRIIAQRTKRGYDRTDLSKDAGVSAEDDKARQDALKRENSLPSKWESAMLNLLNFDQVLRYVFGNDSKIARQISDRQRKADNAKSDDIAALSGEWAAFLSELGGGEMQGQQLLFELSRMDEEIDGVSYSQNQLIAITMMWMQPKGRQHMEGFLDSDGQPAGKWHYNQDFVNKAEKLLRGEAKAIRQYLLDKYDAEYEAINKVYRKVYGLNLPKNQFYSPLVVESIRAPAQAGIDPVTGGVFAAGANSPSALRSRGGAIAQPVFRDAVQTYFGHMLQMAHWKAYAEFNGEVSALLGHRDTRNVVKGKAGEQAATVMNNWLQYFQQGGNKDAANHLAINQWINRMTGNFAVIALFGRISTLALQVTQLGAASAKMPVGAYLSRFGKLMSGRLGWTTALDSDYIQRRIKDMPPAVALAMQGLRADKPSQIRNASRWLGQHLSGFDGFFTAGTYAIVYDYQLSQARQNGMGGQEAADYAREATERIVDEIAQPTRAGARSIYELNSTNPVARAVWAFSSESRKNMGLLMYNLAKGTNREYDKALIYVLLLNGLVGIVIRNAFRDMRDEDDEEIFDEKNWGWKRLAAQFISDPIYGIPVVGETIEGAIFTAFGVYQPTGPVFDVTRGVPAAKRLVTQYPVDLLEGEAEFRDIVADVNRVLAAAGLFNGTIAGAASISNLAKDVFEVGDNVFSGEQ